MKNAILIVLSALIAYGFGMIPVGELIAKIDEAVANK